VLGQSEAEGTPVELEVVEVAAARAWTVAKVVPGADTFVLLSIEPKNVQTEPSNAVPTHEVLWAQVFKQSPTTAAARFLERVRVVPE
jgi:hypothetical protein